MHGESLLCGGSGGTHGFGSHQGEGEELGLVVEGLCVRAEDGIASGVDASKLEIFVCKACCLRSGCAARVSAHLGTARIAR